MYLLQIKKKKIVKLLSLVLVYRQVGKQYVP
jgi:hypothetical protein